MARPSDNSLKYYNRDTVDADNLQYVEAMHGLVGYAIVDKLWQQIYGSATGYYCDFGEINIRLFCKNNGISLDQLEKILETCFQNEIRIFSREMYQTHKILTSSGVQKRWLKIVKEAGRRNTTIKEEYCLIVPDQPDNIDAASVTTPVIPPETTPPPPLSVPETPQSKVKESNSKEIKEKKTLNTNGVAPAEPSPAKKMRVKPKETEPHWKALVKVWFDFNLEKFEEEPSFDGDNPKIFKEKIVWRLKKRAGQKGIDWTQEIACQRLKYFLDSAYAYDAWLPKHFTLSNLAKQFDPVVQKQNEAAKKNNAGPSDLQYLYERFLDGDLDVRVITPTHFRQLAEKIPTMFTLMQQQIPKRMNQLIGSNDAAEKRLWQAYQDGKETPETKTDIPVLMRMAIITFFHYQKSKNIQSVYDMESKPETV